MINPLALPPTQSVTMVKVKVKLMLYSNASLINSYTQNQPVLSKSVFFNLHLEHVSSFGTQFLHKFNQPRISQDDKGSS